MELMTKIAGDKRFQNKIEYNYCTIRIPEALRKTLEIEKGEHIFLDINESKHNPKGKYLVAKLWRENDNEEFRNALKGE